jgi:peptidoglycan hydrolase-like protein with peptidoglycan-binding domain
MSGTAAAGMLVTPPKEASMSARGILSVVGTAVGGLIGWTDEAPPAADPRSLRELFADLGMQVGDDLEAAVRGFQARAGLLVDGVAGPRTVHLLARYAKEARELTRISLPPLRPAIPPRGTAAA